MEKSTATKLPVKKAAPAKKKIHFYFPRSAGASFSNTVGAVNGRGGRCVQVRAKNHILTLDEANADHTFFIARLRKAPENRGNGGTKFVEVDANARDVMDKPNQIDKLLEMDETAIITMLGGDLELHRLTKGGLIAKVLEL